MLTESSNLKLGTKAPDFTLLDTTNNKKQPLDSLKSSLGTVIVFTCNHCPYVIHIQEKMVELIKRYQQKGLAFIAISSNDINAYPDDAPDKMKALAEKYHYSHPYLYDESQEIAKAYDAACTPDFYAFDSDMLLVYHGRFDSASPGNNELVTGNDLSGALDCLINGQPISDVQIPSVGCSIKWK